MFLMQQEGFKKSKVCAHPDIQSQRVSTVLSESGEHTVPQSSTLHHAVCTQHKQDAP